jgi:hypothetical protein
MSHFCQNKPDNFCYICGDLTLIPQRKLLSSLVRKAYEPSEGQAIPCKSMATLRKSDSRSEECSTSSFSQRAENIFTSTSHTTWIN